MKIQTFKNQRGLIHGSDSKRIGCDIAGILKIGTAEISISPDAEAILPALFNGCTGSYSATFTSVTGTVYELEKVTLKNGRIVSPAPISVELMELRSRIDSLEDENEALKTEIIELRNIFDTDSLNFLTK